MTILKFDQTTFEDLQTYGATYIINEICDFMEKEIDKGNIIVIERRYSNEPPDLVSSIKTHEDLLQFKSNY